ncbi:MAG: zinc ribbon domain-containing protein [Ruminococcus sp.]|nr:zinc ribbon domain-containing protein [Ruminococcus sp.]
MSKFCTSCGAQIDDNTAFCPNCGAAQQADAVNPNTAYQAYSAANNNAQPTFDEVSYNYAGDIGAVQEIGKAKNNNTIIGLCAVLLVVIIAAAVLLAIFVFGKKDYEEPIEKLCLAIEEADGGAFADAYADYLVDYMDYNFEEYYDCDTEEWFEEYILEDGLDYLEDEYGDDIKVSYKVTDKEKLDDDDLEDLEDEIKDEYDEKVDVTEGYKLEVEITVKGEDDKETFDGDIFVYNIDDKWCIDATVEDDTFDIVDDIYDDYSFSDD